MKSYVLKELKQPLEAEDRESLLPGVGEAVVSLKAAALNRRDYWITQGMYPGITTPVVLGSDGAGVVSAVGDGVDGSWVGREVVINPGLEWGNTQEAQAGEFHILGLPRDGTFAEEVSVPASALHAKPEHMDWSEAAALPLAGLTAYRALFSQGGLKEGETILITGIGGGVATFALQFAVAAGAKVWVTSSSNEKIERAVSLGAQGGFDYRAEDWAKQLLEKAGAVNLTIDSAGGKGYSGLIDVAAPGGRIVNYGATAGPPEKLDMFKIFWNQLRLQGSTMGSPADFESMLQFVSEKSIKPIVDSVQPLDAVNDALAQMKVSPQFGKYVLKVSD